MISFPTKKVLRGTDPGGAPVCDRLLTVQAPNAAHRPVLRSVNLWVQLLLVAAGGLAVSVFAIDPPHDTAAYCASCHVPHTSLGGDLTSVAGTANLCISCHQPGGPASTTPFAKDRNYLTSNN